MSADAAWGHAARGAVAVAAGGSAAGASRGHRTRVAWNCSHSSQGALHSNNTSKNKSKSKGNGSSGSRRGQD